MKAAHQVNAAGGGNAMKSFNDLLKEFDRMYELKGQWNPRITGTGERDFPAMVTAWSLMLKQGYPEDEKKEVMQGAGLYQHHGDLIYYLMAKHQKKCLEYARANALGRFTLPPAKFRDESAGIHNNICAGANALVVTMRAEKRTEIVIPERHSGGQDSGFAGFGITCQNAVNSPKQTLTPATLLAESVECGGMALQLRTEKHLEDPAHRGYFASLNNLKTALELAAAEPSFSELDRKAYGNALKEAKTMIENFKPQEPQKHMTLVAMVPDNEKEHEKGKCTACLTEDATCAGTCMHVALCTECLAALKAMHGSDTFPCLICRKQVKHSSLLFQ
jgi:hypothetical protein